MPDRRPIGAGAMSIGPDTRTLPDDPTVLKFLGNDLADPLSLGDASAGTGPLALHELLGKIFEGGPKTKLRDKVRLTTYDPAANTATLHSTINNQEYSSPLDQFLAAYKRGDLLPEAAPNEGQTVQQMIKRLLTLTKRMPK